LSGSEKRDEQMERLILDIKALVLLQGSDSQLRTQVQGRLANSHDESIGRFVEALQVGKPPHTLRLVTMAIGELLLASFLVVVGAATLAPQVAGISTTQGFLQYATSSAATTLTKSPFSAYLPFMEFAIGVVLMLSAFAVLRQAALNLKAADLSVKPRES
jgi:hypothetical protein